MKKRFKVLMTLPGELKGRIKSEARKEFMKPSTWLTKVIREKIVELKKPKVPVKVVEKPIKEPKKVEPKVEKSLVLKSAEKVKEYFRNNFENEELTEKELDAYDAAVAKFWPATGRVERPRLPNSIIGLLQVPEGHCFTCFINRGDGREIKPRLPWSVMCQEHHDAANETE